MIGPWMGCVAALPLLLLALVAAAEGELVVGRDFLGRRRGSRASLLSMLGIAARGAVGARREGVVIRLGGNRGRKGRHRSRASVEQERKAGEAATRACSATRTKGTIRGGGRECMLGYWNKDEYKDDAYDQNQRRCSFPCRPSFHPLLSVVSLHARALALFASPCDLPFSDNTTSSPRGLCPRRWGRVPIAPISKSPRGHTEEDEPERSSK